MKTGSLRARVTLVTLSLLVVVLAVVVTAVTLTYRSSLQRDLRHHLTAAGAAVRQSGSANTAKELVRGLALEGIATSVQPAAQALPAGKRIPGRPTPVKPGSSISSRGSLLVLAEVLPDGTRVTFTASEAPITHAVARLLLIEIVVALAALALATLLMMRGTRTALRPLSQVISTSSRIAAGDAELRLRPTRTDTELGSLASAFDQMVDALERAVADAQDTEAAMRRFLADASHELRTPIAALQATAETLLREQPPRPRRDELEAALAGSASRLGRLIDDMLGLARLEGTFQPRPEPVDLAELARTAADEARLQHAGPTIELNTGTAQVHGDANALLRVICNLLDNALAAVPANGRVDVITRRRGDQVQLVVTDDGPGIPDEDRERVFERFIRLDNIHAPGSGLGLAIARRIVRQHNGQLTCDPVPHGASFTLQLPAWERVSV